MSGPVTAPTLRRSVLVATAIVSLLGLAVELYGSFTTDDGWLDVLWPLLSLSAEANVPTWFASSLLLCCALAAGSIASRLQAGEPWRKHWWGIAIALAWVSLDESAELHEHLGGHFETSGILFFDWVIWAALIVAVLAVIYLPFLRALPSPTRERLVIAVVVYVGGALVMELPLGWYVERAGTESLGYALIDWVEETLELVGASLALAALVAHARSRR